MKILGSAVNMTSKHSIDVAETVQESIRIWRDNRAAGAPAAPTIASAAAQGDRLTISKEALEAYRAGAPQVCESSPVTVDAELFGLTPQDRILILVLEKALGIRIRTADELMKTVAGSGKGIAARVQEAMQDAAKQADALKQAATPPDRAGWGYIYERHESRVESETLSFGASALVRTADGQEIAVQLEFRMSRSFASSSSLVVRGGDANLVDPLVINYDGLAADFTGTTFFFDLDADGTKEEISSLRAGSGFLALDKNGDGVINNGTELFGPSTGAGFAELRELDSDGNQWLDASDPAFHNLRIWVKDSSGENRLFALGEKGIGAIYVGNIAAQFSVKDAANALLAQNKRMGIYLAEDGQPGTIQEVDLAVRPPSTRT